VETAVELAVVVVTDKMLLFTDPVEAAVRLNRTAQMPLRAMDILDLY
jgi:hypothetical protein